MTEFEKHVSRLLMVHEKKIDEIQEVLLMDKPLKERLEALERAVAFLHLENDRREGQIQTLIETVADIAAELDCREGEQPE